MLKKGVPLNLSHFACRALQSGHQKTLKLSEEEFRLLLTQKIGSLDVRLAVDDISRFVLDFKPLKIWSREYFMQLADRMKIIEA